MPLHQKHDTSSLDSSLIDSHGVVMHKNIHRQLDELVYAGWSHQEGFHIMEYIFNFKETTMTHGA